MTITEFMILFIGFRFLLFLLLYIIVAVYPLPGCQIIRRVTNSSLCRTLKHKNLTRPPKYGYRRRLGAKGESSIKESFEPKKLALIRIWQILKNHSDSNHPMTQEEIASHLEREYGIVLERKAIGRNLSLLKEAGIYIDSRKSGSFLRSGDFDDSELRVLIDSVLANRDIAHSYSKDLIERLCSLSNQYFRAKVQYAFAEDIYGKTKQRDTFYKLELIDEAIGNGLQLAYDYNAFGTDRKLHRVSSEHVSPLRTIFKDGHYYLLGRSEESGKTVSHRLDHITSMELTEQKASHDKYTSLQKSDVNMGTLPLSLPFADTGALQHAEFLADEEMTDLILDCFGENARLSHAPGEKTVRVNVLTYYGIMNKWALQYADRVEILQPASLRAQVKEALTASLRKYSA